MAGSHRPSLGPGNELKHYLVPVPIRYPEPYPGLKCAGKRLPDVVFQLATAQERTTIIRQCEAECALLARLRHPNIVQFLGVHYDKGSDVPTLVTECMHTSLNACINRHGVLPDEVAYSILHDIALALTYLNGNSPPIIHCNLNSANILLSADMRAKISDFLLKTKGCRATETSCTTRGNHGNCYICIYIYQSYTV